VELYLCSAGAPLWRGAQLGEARGQLYLYLFSFLSSGYRGQSDRCVKRTTQIHLVPRLRTLVSAMHPVTHDFMA
jgi:hypothetical protein